MSFMEKINFLDYLKNNDHDPQNSTNWLAYLKLPNSLKYIEAVKSGFECMLNNRFIVHYIFNTIIINEETIIIVAYIQLRTLQRKNSIHRSLLINVFCLSSEHILGVFARKKEWESIQVINSVRLITNCELTKYGPIENGISRRGKAIKKDPLTILPNLGILKEKGMNKLGSKSESEREFLENIDSDTKESSIIRSKLVALPLKNEKDILTYIPELPEEVQIALKEKGFNAEKNIKKKFFAIKDSMDQVTNQNVNYSDRKRIGFANLDPKDKLLIRKIASVIGFYLKLYHYINNKDKTWEALYTEVLRLENESNLFSNAFFLEKREPFSVFTDTVRRMTLTFYKVSNIQLIKKKDSLPDI